MLSEAKQKNVWGQVNIIFTTCHWDNYLFHKNSVSKYVCQKYYSPSPPPPGDWMRFFFNPYRYDTIIGAKRRIRCVGEKNLRFQSADLSRVFSWASPRLSGSLLRVFAWAGRQAPITHSLTVLRAVCQVDSPAMIASPIRKVGWNLGQRLRHWLKFRLFTAAFSSGWLIYWTTACVNISVLRFFYFLSIPVNPVR